MRRADVTPPDPRLAEFIERLAEALAADYFRQLAAEKQSPHEEETPK
jgi:hypothetical protein